MNRIQTSSFGFGAVAGAVALMRSLTILIDRLSPLFRALLSIFRSKDAGHRKVTERVVSLCLAGAPFMELAPLSMRLVVLGDTLSRFQYFQRLRIWDQAHPEPMRLSRKTRI